ncbi:MAG: hypothetical protein KatS3mg082_3416 [Nitrospiraceae bacterium]|nr:MAG: hypothetical protein KatS3mg082_3416 [Nitrospiraceae bacterium]
MRTFALLNLSALATSHLLLPIFGLTRPATEVALLDLAFRLSFLVFLPFQIINSVSSPIVIQLWTNRDVKLLQRIYNISRAISFLSGALAIVLLLLVAPALCTILELKDCALFRNVLFILCVGQLAYAACGPVAWLLYAAGHENVAIRIQLYALLFMVTLTPITTTLWGATGAAFTSTLALWAWRLSLARAARRVMCSQTDPQAR